MNKICIVPFSLSMVLAFGLLNADATKPAPATTTAKVASTSAAQETVYISTASIQQTELGKELMEGLTKRANEFSTKLQDKRQAAAKVEEGLKSRASLLTADAREKEEKKLRELSREFEDLREEAGREIEKLQQQAMLELNKAAISAAEELAKKHNYKEVKDSTTALYVDKTLDRTEEFVKIMNTQFAQKKDTKKTAAA